MTSCEEDAVCHHDLPDGPEVDVDLLGADGLGQGPGPGQEEGPDPPVEPEQGGAPHRVRHHLRADLHTPGHAAHGEAGVVKPES